MKTTALIILLASLALAAGAAYWFLQWKCLTVKEEITQLIEFQEEETDFLKEIEESTPVKIKEGKKQLTEEIIKVRKLQKQKAEELSEEEQESVDKLPVLEEIQTLLQKVERKEDLDRKVYGYWDYVYAGGIALVVFGISGVVGNLISKKTKGGNE